MAGGQAYASSSPAITLIIDDLGYNLRNGLRAVNLPGPVTVAILPHTPFSKRLATQANQQGKTIMLHAPMTNVHQRSPGPGALSPDMDRTVFDQTLEKALADIPFVQGVNNHMGSELTQDGQRMKWLMEAVAKRKLFFIDSKTTAKSVAAETAKEHGIPSMSRDIFLDHIRTPEAVSEAFDALIVRAKRKGYAVAIGHPHRVTLDVLEARLPELKQHGIRLVSVSDQLVAMGQAYPDSAPVQPWQNLAPQLSLNHTAPSKPLGLQVNPVVPIEQVEQVKRVPSVLLPRQGSANVTVVRRQPEPLSRTEAPTLRQPVSSGREVLSPHYPEGMLPAKNQSWITPLK